MDQTLVVVTCYRDIWQFELLCNTMEKFLESCSVLFILNECDQMFALWKDWFDVNFKNKLSKFDILIKKRSDFLSVEYDIPGWFTQQILKLAAHQYVMTDGYLVLDSKNFFTQDIVLNKIGQRPPILIQHDNQWYNYILELYHYFKIEIPENIYLTDNMTPFSLNTRIVKSLIEHFGGNDKTFQAMIDKGLDPQIAEFYLYGVYEQQFNNQILYSDEYNMYLKDHVNIHESYTHSNRKIFGIHRYLFYGLEENALYNLLRDLNCGDCIPEGPSPSSRQDVAVEPYLNFINNECKS
jgi:hypothetical protein